jgi:hypothetical protein
LHFRLNRKNQRIRKDTRIPEKRSGLNVRHMHDDPHRTARIRIPFLLVVAATYFRINGFCFSVDDIAFEACDAEPSQHRLTVPSLFIQIYPKDPKGPSIHP